MSNFAQAIVLTLRWEGKFQNNPNDPGNYNSDGNLVGTNYGISAKTYENYLGYPPTTGTMQSMSQQTAIDIFKSNYWDRYNLESINDQSLANQIFDLTVHHVKFMWIISRSLIAQGFPVTINAIWDGSIITDINSVKNIPEFNNLLVKYRKDYFQYLISRDSKLSVFYNGWNNRANSYLLGIGSKKNLLAWGVGLAAIAFFPIAIRTKKKSKR